MRPDHDGTPFVGGGKVGGGRFVLEKKVGQGGMGIVWLAFDETLNQRVALKFLPPEVQSDPTALEDLRHETLETRKLSHPNIVRIHDFHRCEGEATFISMEYVDGPTLCALKAREPDVLFSWETLEPILLQLCEALEYAHANQVIHRDLKPANLMLDRHGNLKLTDFGIAAAAGESVTRQTGARHSSGTPAYMSPQQIEGKAPQPSDDIYAFGSLVYELLTSKTPFFRGHLWHQVLTIPVTPIQDRLREFGLTNPVPEAVASLVMACLSKQPELRPASFKDVRAWLSASANSASLDGAASSEIVIGPAPRNRQRALLAILGIVALVTTLAGSWSYWNARKTIAIAPVNKGSDSQPALANGSTNLGAFAVEEPANPHALTNFTLSDEALMQMAMVGGRAWNSLNGQTDAPGPGVHFTVPTRMGQATVYELRKESGKAPWMFAADFSKYSRFGLKFTLLAIDGNQTMDRGGNFEISCRVHAVNQRTQVKSGVVALREGRNSLTIFTECNGADLDFLSFSLVLADRESWTGPNAFIGSASSVTVLVEPAPDSAHLPLAADVSNKLVASAKSIPTTTVTLSGEAISLLKLARRVRGANGEIVERRDLPGPGVEFDLLFKAGARILDMEIQPRDFPAFMQADFSKYSRFGLLLTVATSEADRNLGRSAGLYVSATGRSLQLINSQEIGRDSVVVYADLKQTPQALGFFCQLGKTDGWGFNAVKVTLRVEPAPAADLFPPVNSPPATNVIQTGKDFTLSQGALLNFGLIGPSGPLNRKAASGRGAQFEFTLKSGMDIRFGSTLADGKTSWLTNDFRYDRFGLKFTLQGVDGQTNSKSVDKISISPYISYTPSGFISIPKSIKLRRLGGNSVAAYVNSEYAQAHPVLGLGFYCSPPDDWSPYSDGMKITLLVEPIPEIDAWPLLRSAEQAELK